MLQKGFHVVILETLTSAKDRLLEDADIELILCDLSLPDGTALGLFHDLRYIVEDAKMIIRNL